MRILKLVLLIVPIFALGQNLPNPIPQTPETASFSKFQATPVSYHTGIPNITVPIYTLESRSLSIPISISYHAGGIRINEEASAIGLGWSLIAGGQITRAMKGMPDEKFYLTTTDVKVLDFENLSKVSGSPGYFERYQIIDNVKNGINDLEPDRFNYSFLDYSGSFMFNQNRSLENPYGEIIHMPKSDVKINPSIVNGQIVSWQITTPDGTVFNFNAGKERIINANNYSIDKIGGLLYAPTISPTGNYFNTWRISSIETHTGDIINFEYETFQLTSCNLGMESYNGHDSGLTQVNDSYESHIISSSSTIIESSRITKITSSKGTIDFLYSARNDIADVDSRRLSMIEISNSNGKKLKRISLQQSYFQSDIPQGSERIEAELISCGNGFDENADTKRLRLDGLSIIGLYNNLSNQTGMDYNFGYSPIQLPHKKSYAQDFWGFYNGENSNLSMIPSIPLQNYPLEDISFFSGANRYVNPDDSQAGMLTKITYPKGGYEEFKYENNKCSIDNVAATELTFISPPNTEKRLNLNTSRDSFYLNGEVDPLTGLNIYHYRKTFEITDDILNNGELVFEVFSDVCYGGGNLVFGNQCNVTGGLRKLGSTNTIAFSMGTTSGTTYSATANVTPGTYEVFANVSATDFPTNGGALDIDIRWISENDQNIAEDLFLVGGLRILEKSIFDADSTPISKTNYTYNNHLTTNIGVPVFAEPIEVILDYCSHSYQADVTRFTSSPVYPLVTNQAGFVGYLEVQEVIQGYDKLNQSFETSPTVYNTFRYSARNRESYKGSPVDYNWIRGNLEESDLNSKLITSYGFDISSSLTEYLNNNYVEGFEARLLKSEVVICPSSSFRVIRNSNLPEQKFVQTGGHNHLVSQLETQKENNGDISIQRTYEYNAEIEKPTKVQTDYGNGTVHQEYFEYSNSGMTITELPSTAKSILEAQNRKELIKSWKQDENDELLDLILYNYPNSVSNSEPLLPESISNLKGVNGNLDERVRYHSYTNFGLPREVSKVDGSHTYYIWGYNGQYPIAKIENFGSDQITTTVQNLINATVTASDNDDSVADENTLRTALSNLRNTSALSNAMVTTYTYDPLVGITSITDPKGYTIYYEYDEFNR
ncbi:MAG: hypothetical protein ABJP92_16830, partial [Flavobacteriaceae bacterium]